MQRNPTLLHRRDHKNKTALYYACCKGNFNIANDMLNFSSNLVDTDQDRNITIHIAVKHSADITIATVFTNHMSNLYCENNDGHTPLCLAIHARKRIIFQLFQLHITIDIATKVQHACLEHCSMDLHELCVQQCSTLLNYILPPLTDIVFAFLGIVPPTTKAQKI